MKLVVFGANGPTGRMVAEMAVAEGHAVTAVTRHPNSFPLNGASPRVAGADVLDAVAVDRVVAGHDALVSALGVPYTKKPVTVYSRGIANIIRAMRSDGLRRDLADALLREAVEDRSVGGAIYVVTTDGVPTFARMFLKEALRIGD